MYTPVVDTSISSPRPDPPWRRHYASEATGAAPWRLRRRLWPHICDVKSHPPMWSNCEGQVLTSCTSLKDVPANDERWPQSRNSLCTAWNADRTSPSVRWENVRVHFARFSCAGCIQDIRKFASLSANDRSFGASWFLSPLSASGHSSFGGWRRSPWSFVAAPFRRVFLRQQSRKLESGPSGRLFLTRWTLQCTRNTESFVWCIIMYGYQ